MSHSVSSLVLLISNPEIPRTFVRAKRPSAAAPIFQGDASASLDPLFRRSYTLPGSEVICEFLLNDRSSGSQWEGSNYVLFCSEISGMSMSKEETAR